MIAAFTIAAGSMTAGGRSYAAKESSFEEEIIIEENNIEEESTGDKGIDDESIDDESVEEEYGSGDEKGAPEEPSDTAEIKPYDEISDESEASDKATEAATADEAGEADEADKSYEEILVEEDNTEASDTASADTSIEEELPPEIEISEGRPNPTLYAGAVKGRWICRNNKWTYENARGEARDDDGKSLDNNVAHIGDNFYYFKDGYMCTGFIYFDEEGRFTTAKKAKNARYCDPMSGVLKTGMFAVEGKEYYALSDAKFYGLIRCNIIFLYNENLYYADKTGAVLKGKGFSLDGKSYFAKEDGTLYRNGYAIIDGKMYRFNSDCSVFTEAIGPYCYYASKKNGKTESAFAYILCKNPKKPEDGRWFYADEAGKKKLTSCWIYGARDLKESSRLYYLDKKGDMVTGVFSISGTRHLFGEADAANAGLFQSSYEGTYEYKGRKCFILDGIMVTKPGFFFSSWQRSYYYVLNKSGELAQGDIIIKTKQYPKGKNYSFDSFNRLRVNDYEVKRVKHVLNHRNDKNPEVKGPEDHYVLSNEAEVEKFLTTEEGAAYRNLTFNSDGTLLNGIKTVDGKKYLYYQGEPVHVKYLNTNHFNITAPFVIFTGGKGYLVGQDSAVMTGWFRTPADKLILMDFDYAYGMKKDIYMYFSPEEECAVEGIYSAPVPKLDKNGTIALDNSGNVITTGKKAELCFTTAENSGTTDYYGKLVRNDEYTIGKKVYVTDGAGVAKLIQDGPVSKDGEIIYRNSDGSTSTGRKDSYYYDPSTGYQLKNVLRCSSKKWYFYGKDGKESTALTEVTLDDGKKAFIIYSKNGSINSFKYENGKKVSGRAFTYGSGYYFIGKNGNLTTGLIKQKLVSQNTDVTTYVDSDGRCFYKNPAYSDRTFMVKIGKKIYAMKGGEIVKGSSKPYGVNDFSRLPEADKRNMEKYWAMACFYAGEVFSDNPDDYEVPVYVNEDGSVSEKILTKDGRQLHINKYGICMEDMSPFRREGKNWYYTRATEAGSAVIDGMYTTFERTPSVECKIAFSWDNNMKMGKLVDNSTGKPLSGWVDYKITDPLTGKIIPVNIALKNGLFATGKFTMKEEGLSYPIYFDADTAIFDYMAYEELRRKYQKKYGNS